jgi:hypothetical protein
MPKIPSKSEVQKDAEAEVESFKDELGPFVVAAENRIRRRTLWCRVSKDRICRCALIEHGV